MHICAASSSMPSSRIELKTATKQQHGKVIVSAMASPRSAGNSQLILLTASDGSTNFKRPTLYANLKFRQNSLNKSKWKD